MEQQLLTNLQPSPFDARDKIANLPLLSFLPVSVDLKADVYEVENQYLFNACTANAGCSALELMYKRNGTPVDLSRMYLYYYTRQLAGLTGDSGAYPRDIGKALLKYGTCYETTWPYNVPHLDLAPVAEATTEAAPFKIQSYEQIVGDVLPQIKTALAQGIPVLVTMKVTDGFSKITGPWTSHTWDTSTPVTGSHEVLAIGYDDKSGRLLLENSWSASWADGGFFGMPYEMVTSGVAYEFWILTPSYQGVKPVTPLIPDSLLSPAPSAGKIKNNKIIFGAMVIAIIIFFLMPRH